MKSGAKTNTQVADGMSKVVKRRIDVLAKQLIELTGEAKQQITLNLLSKSCLLKSKRTRLWPRCRKHWRAARSQDGYRHLINISGGKDSAALAVYLKQEYPDIEGEYVFCDTLCELPETYEYLERLEILLGCEVKRITAFDVLNIEAKPGRNPFDIYLKELYGGFLPNLA